MCVTHKDAHCTPGDVVTGVSKFLRATGRRNLKQEIAAVLRCSESKADKVILGDLNSITAHDLLNLDRHFNGELLRALRGLPEDEKSRRMLTLINEIREIAQS